MPNPEASEAAARLREIADGYPKTLLPRDARLLRSLAHNLESGVADTPEQAALKLSADPAEAGKSLSAEERAEYERCQRSIVEAQRSAQQNEGNIVIGGADTPPDAASERCSNPECDEGYVPDRSGPGMHLCPDEFHNPADPEPADSSDAGAGERWPEVDEGAVEILAAVITDFAGLPGDPEGAVEARGALEWAMKAGVLVPASALQQAIERAKAAETRVEALRRRERVDHEAMVKKVREQRERAEKAERDLAEISASLQAESNDNFARAEKAEAELARRFEE